MDNEYFTNDFLSDDKDISSYSDTAVSKTAPVEVKTDKTAPKSDSVPAKQKAPVKKRPAASKRPIKTEHQSSSSKRISNPGFKNLGNIIKFIAFVFAFGIIVISFVVAFFLYSKSLTFAALCFGIIILGVLFAALTFFPIYGLGHAIIQNYEILKRLEK